MKKDRVLKNLKDHYGLVESSEDGEHYVIDHRRFPADQFSNEDAEFEVHPISDDGDIDYERKIKKKATMLSPKMVSLGSLSMDDIVERLKKT